MLFGVKQKTADQEGKRLPGDVVESRAPVLLARKPVLLARLLLAGKLTTHVETTCVKRRRALTRQTDVLVTRRPPETCQFFGLAPALTRWRWPLAIQANLTIDDVTIRRKKGRETGDKRVAFGQFSDLGDGFIVEVDVVHLASQGIRYGPTMTMVVSLVEELDINEMMCVLKEVVMPKTRELQNAWHCEGQTLWSRGARVA